MAYEGDLKIIPGLVAAADLSAKQHTAIVIDSNGKAAANTTAGGPVQGVLQDKPDAADKSASVAYSGVTKCVIGAAVAKGDLVQSDTSGRAIPTAATKFFFGTALEGASNAGEIISVLLSPTGYSPV